jgi:hypothetical protein
MDPMVERCGHGDDLPVATNCKFSGPARFAHTRDSHTHTFRRAGSQSSFPTSFMIPLLVEEGDLETKRKEGIHPDAVLS